MTGSALSGVKVVIGYDGTPVLLSINGPIMVGIQLRGMEASLVPMKMGFEVVTFPSTVLHVHRTVFRPPPQSSAICRRGTESTCVG